MARFLLLLGALAPVLYLGAVLGAAWFYPGYNLELQDLNALGAQASPHREIFNDGLMAAGALAILGAFGFFLVLHRLSRGFVFAVLATVAIGLWGLSLVMGGLYPQPDPRHAAYNLGLAIEAAPLLVMLGLLRDSKLAWLKTLSLLAFLASAAVLAIILGAGKATGIAELTMRPADLGLWQRAYLACILPWIVLTALGLSAAIGRHQRRATIAAKLALD